MNWRSSNSIESLPENISGLTYLVLTIDAFSRATVISHFQFPENESLVLNDLLIK